MEIKAAEGKIAKTNSNTFGIDESADVGTDENTPVILDMRRRKNSQVRLSGKIETFPGKK